MLHEGPCPFHLRGPAWKHRSSATVHRWLSLKIRKRPACLSGPGQRQLKPQRRQKPRQPKRSLIFSFFSLREFLNREFVITTRIGMVIHQRGLGGLSIWPEATFGDWCR